MTCTSTRRTRKPGGLLRYGIPDFKLEKRHVDRRVEQMKAEGRDLPLRRQCRRRHAGRGSRRRSYDAVVLAGGAEKPRDLPIPGRDLQGVHFAMEFLPQQNRRVGRTSRCAPTTRSSPPASTWW